MNKNSRTSLFKLVALVNFIALLALFLYVNSTKTERQSIPTASKVERLVSVKKTKLNANDTSFYSHKPTENKRLSSSKSIIIIQNPILKNGQEQLIEMLLNKNTK